MKVLVWPLLLILTLLSTDLFAKGKGGSVHVKGYYRKDGTYVQPHYRSAPDGNFNNNWITKGNVNPYTGEAGTKDNPPTYSAGTSSSTYSTGSIGQSSYAPPSTTPMNEDGQRALHWEKQGYNFDPNIMTAYSMNEKVKDIERSRFWMRKGYNFDPDIMTAYSMNEKVKDIQTAAQWKTKGYSFDPDIMTAYSMNEKVKDIERSKFWEGYGYNFNPEIMTAYSMNEKVKDIQRSKYWAEKGYTFDPDLYTAYSMDEEVKDIQRAEFWKNKRRVATQNRSNASRTVKQWRGYTKSNSNAPIESADWFASLDECKAWAIGSADSYRNEAFQFEYECITEFSQYKEKMW
jgi:hypothetical protein